MELTFWPLSVRVGEHTGALLSSFPYHYMSFLSRPLFLVLLEEID